ncbi:phosphonate C-P lyase system protein PhnH [Actibacterium sp. D379-3]
MQVPPAFSVEEAQDNATFDALLRALSRPGTLCVMPAADEAPIINALLDRECRSYSADPRLMPQILRTGALVADLAQADHAFLGTLSDLAPLAELATGSDLYPDAGATVIVQARLGDGAALRLTGPGIDGAATINVGGLPDGFWQRRAELIRYPMGFDLLLTDGASVMGVPRSTCVEVL